MHLFRMALLVLFCLFLSMSFCVAAPSYRAHVDKYLRSAHNYLNVKKPEMAEKVLDQAVVRFPRALELYYLRAKVRHGYLKKDTLALQDFSLVLRSRPDQFPKAFWYRGDIYVGHGQYQQAIKDYTACLKRMPTYGKVYFKRARALFKLGYYREASADLKRCVRYSPVYQDAVTAFRKENHLWL